MPQQFDTKTIAFPLGGLNRRLAVQSQPPYTTPLCLNIFPDDPISGRGRGGPRPPSHSLGPTGSGTPYNWCRGSYYDSGTKIGVFLTGFNGTYESLDGTSWTPRINPTPVSFTFPNMASSAVYKGTLYHAMSGDNCREKVLPGGSVNSLSDAGGGTAPENCGLVLHHADRLWLMNQSDAPHVIYASAVGDATNWDTSDPTDGGAFTNTGAEGGVVGDPIIAAISSGDYLYFGGPTSIYVIAGNPKVSGVRQVSYNVGPVTQTAWCIAPDGYVYMITPDGLYRMPPGGGEPEQISRRIIPDELMGVNGYSGDKVCIGYDQRWRGLFIGVDHHLGSSYDTQWWFKLPDGEFPGSFWPLALPAVMQLALTFPELISEDTSSLLTISSAGSAFQLDRTHTSETFDHYMFLGPIYCGDGGSEGILLSISASLAEGSQDCNWEIYGGTSAESAYQSADPPSQGFVSSFTSKAPRYPSSGSRKWTLEKFNYWHHPRVRCHVFFIKIYDLGNKRFILEDIVYRRKSLGLRRVS